MGSRASFSAWLRSRRTAPLRQARPHSVCELAHIELLTQSENQILAYVASCAAMVMLGAVRFAHAQRSAVAE